MVIARRQILWIAANGSENKRRHEVQRRNFKEAIERIKFARRIGERRTTKNEEARPKKGI